MIQNYRFGQKIGEGTFAEVYIASDDQSQVAIKVLKKASLKTERDQFRVNKEIELLKKVDHPGIVKLLQIFEDDDSIYLIQEYVSGGELFDYIIEQERLTDEEARHIMQQLINVLDYLHQMGIIHRDLKPENILMRDNGDICLIDFGLSMEVDNGQLLQTPCGSPCYAAPEMLEGRNYDGTKTDVWSCGVILYAMLCGYLPFDEENTQDLYEKIKACSYRIPNSLAPGARDLICQILQEEDSRITIERIIQHPWFQGNDFEASQPATEVSVEQVQIIESQHTLEVVEEIEEVQNRPRGHTLKRESIMNELEVNVFPRQPKFNLPINERKNLQTIELAYQIIQESSRMRIPKVPEEELKKSKVQITTKPAMRINSNRQQIQKKPQQHVRYRD